MKNRLWILLLIVHGFMHLIAFLVNWHIIPNDLLEGKMIPTLPGDLTLVPGVFWLLASVLFIISSIYIIRNSSVWLFTSALAVPISQILIITSWQDAGLGTIINLVIVLKILWEAKNVSNKKKINKEIHRFLEDHKEIQFVNNYEKLKTLPTCVQNWIKTSGILNLKKIQTICIKQEGDIVIEPGTKSRPIITQLWFAIDTPAFIAVVNSRTKVFNFFSAFHKSENGKSNFYVRSLPIFKTEYETEGRINRMALQLYLAALCWFPVAALNDLITWQELAPNVAQAILEIGEVTAIVVFEFDAENNIVKLSGKGYLQKANMEGAEEWFIPINTREFHNGVKIPVKGDIIMHLKTGDYNYLKWKIKSILYH